jgi:hypothetical protein
MKKFYKYLTVLIVPFSLVFFSYPTGSPGGKTGSPGDGGVTCHECHASFDVIEATDWITTNIPTAGYIAGETYEITATGIFEGVVNFGFELTAEDSEGNKQGVFTLIDEERTQYTNSNSAVTHTEDGNNPTGDTNTWTMEWTAPTDGVGDITFYAAFNAGNGADGTSGDQIFTAQMTVNETGVGLGDELLANQTRAFPNPATNFVNVELPRDAQIRIVDLLGHQVFTKQNTNHSERIDIAEFEKGVYFLQIMHEGNSATKRIVKN